MICDDSFLRRLKELQPAAFETLVEQYEGPLYRFFFCDHRDHHVAEEQTAETFTQLVGSLQSMQGGPEQLRAFVFGIARHVQRRRWRVRKQPNLPITYALEVPDPGLSPATQAGEVEQRELVLQALGRLEQPLRNVMFMRFVEACSLEEIAKALDMPVGTVKSHIHRGRARLRETFKVEDCQR